MSARSPHSRARAREKDGTSAPNTRASDQMGSTSPYVSKRRAKQKTVYFCNMTRFMTRKRGPEGYFLPPEIFLIV
jgi:hypothetical protein